MVLSSAGAMATIRSMEALGPLRMMLVPVPLPMEMLSSMQPRVQLSEDDRQALLMFRTVSPPPP
jgi:aarF domain-containing kinase